MARKPGTSKQINALRHAESARRNIPTAEHVIARATSLTISALSENGLSVVSFRQQLGQHPRTRGTCASTTPHAVRISGHIAGA
jgi:hypothetical protein